MSVSATVKLAQQLIQCPSITPLDAGCMDILISHLQALDFHCEALPFGAVSNLWAYRGSEGPSFVFAGHTDVVPTGPLEQWTYPPFSASIDNGILYGRGAADMKGSLAAMVTAVEGYLAKNPDSKQKMAFLITSDEEGPGLEGTQKVMAELHKRKIQLDYCLIGEPSSEQVLGDTLKQGRRGSLHGHLDIFGLQGHIAYPHKADNAIHKALHALELLTKTRWDEANENFPASTFQISNIQAGTGALNVIPGTLTCDFNFRFSTSSSPESLQAKVEAILQTENLNFKLNWTLAGQPFLSSQGRFAPIVLAAIQNVTGIKAHCCSTGGTSDGRFIAPYGVEVLEFGPINASIHAIDEGIAIKDLDTLSAVYEQILSTLT